jgi:hypothetical protein
MNGSDPMLREPMNSDFTTFLGEQYLMNSHCSSSHSSLFISAFNSPKSEDFDPARTDQLVPVQLLVGPCICICICGRAESLTMEEGGATFVW